ncbi:MAG: signal peptidase I [Planctomycetota bacterium]|jgi:signal peptidase I
MSDRPTRQRTPWIAAVLSLFCTGLGHVYCGRVARGATLFLLAMVFVPVYLLIACLSPSTALLTVLAGSILLVIPVYLFAVVDSVRIAGDLREGIDLSAWNSAVVYAIGVVLGFAAPLAGMLLLRSVAFQAYYCPARSMEPTVRPGDRVLVNKLTFAVRSPERGEVVVFRNPEDRTKNYIKRVVGLPGDRVEIRDGTLYLNGRQEPDGRTGIPGEEMRETVVPDRCFFVLGDARGNSRDSRQFGCVPEEEMIGPLQYVFYPPARFGRLSDPDPEASP